MKKILMKFVMFICVVTISLTSVLPLNTSIAYANSWDKLEPYSVIETENTVEYVYRVSEEELAEIEQYYGSNNLSVQAAGTTYGSIYVPSGGTVASVAAAIANGIKNGVTAAVVFGAAAVILNADISTVYYSYTQSSWRDSNGRFHVSVTINFYRDSGYSSYITGTTFSRVYEAWE